MPAAYLVGHITVRNDDKWAEYCSKVPATLVPWNAELVFRGTQAARYAGDIGYDEIVVIRFPDTGTVDQWFHSAAYQALLPVRTQAAEVVLTSYQA